MPRLQRTSQAGQGLPYEKTSFDGQSPLYAKGSCRMLHKQLDTKSHFEMLILAMHVDGDHGPLSFTAATGVPRLPLSSTFTG